MASNPKLTFSSGRTLEEYTANLAKSRQRSKELLDAARESVEEERRILIEETSKGPIRRFLSDVFNPLGLADRFF